MNIDNYVAQKDYIYTSMKQAMNINKLAVIAAKPTSETYSRGV